MQVHWRVVLGKFSRVLRLRDIGPRRSPGHHGCVLLCAHLLLSCFLLILRSRRGSRPGVGAVFRRCLAMFLLRVVRSVIGWGSQGIRRSGSLGVWRVLVVSRNARHGRGVFIRPPPLTQCVCKRTPVKGVGVGLLLGTAQLMEEIQVLLIRGGGSKGAIPLSRGGGGGPGIPVVRRSVLIPGAETMGPVPGTGPIRSGVRRV